MQRKEKGRKARSAMYIAAAAVAALVVAILACFFLARRSGGGAVRRDLVLLWGPNDAGKTVLHQRVRQRDALASLGSLPALFAPSSDVWKVLTVCRPPPARSSRAASLPRPSVALRSWSTRGPWFPMAAMLQVHRAQS